MGWNSLDTLWARVRVALTPRPTFVPLGDHALAVTWRGDRIFLSARDLGITPYLATSRRWEPAVERLLGRLLRPGHIVVECGANVGYHTLGMGHAVGPAGHVHAFEANPEVIRLLQLTIGMARFRSRVTIANLAVSDRAGMVQIMADPSNTASGHIACQATGHLYTQKFTVPAIRLDDALADQPGIDLLRMDIEGSEGLALQGANALIARSPNLRIVLEWAPALMQLRSNVADTVAFLARHGFQAQVIDRAGLRPVPLDALPTMGIEELLFTRP